MRVVIAEGHVLPTDGLLRLLAAHHHQVVATVDSGPDLVNAVETHWPDVAVVTSAYRPRSPMRTALRRDGPPSIGTPILILSQYVEAAYARELLTAGGGTGYLLRDRISRPGEFVHARSTGSASGPCSTLRPSARSSGVTRPANCSPR